ncbi:hypothetical protein SBBP2_50019 [Burkholderiales bacterium]|nr:hypothetical protein SBBP2_50019 [Burkholderiales bacterium]
MAVPIARPAGSSMALLMRRPDDSCSTAVFSLLFVFARLVCAISDRTLVFTTIDIFVSFRFLYEWQPTFEAGSSYYPSGCRDSERRLPVSSRFASTSPPLLRRCASRCVRSLIGASGVEL